MTALPSLKKILLVAEDSRAAAQIIRILGANGFSAKASISVSDCVKTAARFLPDVVLMNTDCHHKSGCAAALKLRRTPGLSAVHLVALTASRDAQILTNIARAGFDELLPTVSGPDRIMLACR